MFAFAANSILCRLALQDQTIDATTFTYLLFTYALCFSIAYLELSTGTGALLLFGTVQLSLLAAHFFQGNRINALELVGLVVSISGFVYLMAPSVTRPDILSARLTDTVVGEPRFKLLQRYRPRFDFRQYCFCCWLHFVVSSD